MPRSKSKSKKKGNGPANMKPGCASAVEAHMKQSQSMTAPTLAPRRQRYISIDVECIASGPGHNDRVPCWVAAVDETGSVLLNAKISVDPNSIFSTLTHITGVTSEMLEREGQPILEVMERLYSVLGPEVVIVGQSVQGDVDWLALDKGVHYSHIVCLADQFKFWNTKFENHHRHSLANAAYGLLDKRIIQQAAHSPVEDAQVSMELFMQFVRPPGAAEKAAKRLFQLWKQKLLLPRVNKPTPDAPCEGDGSSSSDEVLVCSFKYNPSKCFCGQPSGVNI